MGTCTEVLKETQPLNGQNQNLSKNGPLLKSEGQKQGGQLFLNYDSRWTNTL